MSTTVFGQLWERIRQFPQEQPDTLPNLAVGPGMRRGGALPRRAPARHESSGLAVPRSQCRTLPFHSALTELLLEIPYILDDVDCQSGDATAIAASVSVAVAA